ncbi:unnamed protein product [Cyclocybe aegerita]|uniref:DUF3533 domain-containing protein n=1 Tax=Cyclocybe aegerita TaxID=1973307 RepID=A0A8S0VRH0_CYCAE|nr:unnamed protein product [Cyclocybe aegerita]
MPTSVSSRPTSRTTMTVEKPTGRFRDKTKEAAVARTIYLEIFFGGCITTILIFFPVFSIFWGSLWRTPAHNLQGWVIDFDGAAIGQGVVEALATPPPGARITWTPVLASQFPGGPHDVGLQILDQKSWLALTINPGTTARLTASIASPNASYNGADAITVFATEARNENAFRSIIRPSIQITMDVLSNTIAVQTARQVANSPNIAQLLTVSPQTVTAPISYRIRNMAPFDQPVAAAVTFIGLLYQLILSFFVVMNSHGAREASGLDKTLSTRSLIKLRFVSSFFAYFIISLFYSLLSLAFRLNVNRKFGHSGFMIFWMLNYVAMLSVGLALESLITILTPKFISSFMMMWIIGEFYEVHDHQAEGIDVYHLLQ